MFGISKLVIYAVIALAAAGALAAVRQHYINQGWDRAIQAVEKKNAEAATAARAAQSDVDRCYEQGGIWSQITGSCAANPDSGSVHDDRPR